MTPNHKNEIPQNAIQDEEVELTEDELDDVAGGAARMLSGRRTRSGTARASGTSSKLAHNTGPTLCSCLPECTVTISGC